jgi:hypothetical protein
VRVARTTALTQATILRFMERQRKAAGALVVGGGGRGASVARIQCATGGRASTCSSQAGTRGSDRRTSRGLGHDRADLRSQLVQDGLQLAAGSFVKDDGTRVIAVCRRDCEGAAEAHQRGDGIGELGGLLVGDEGVEVLDGATNAALVGELDDAGADERAEW